MLQQANCERNPGVTVVTELGPELAAARVLIDVLFNEIESNTMNDSAKERMTVLLDAIDGKLRAAERAGVVAGVIDEGEVRQ
jgi:hypothetical protein